VALRDHLCDTAGVQALHTFESGCGQPSIPLGAGRFGTALVRKGLVGAAKRRLLAGLALGAAMVWSPTSAAAAEALPCPTTAWLSGAIGAGAGVLGSFGSAGILAAADNSRDFDWLRSAAIASGVTAGLGLLFAASDHYTGCSMSQGRIALSVPIVLGIVGTGLPLAIWGASDKLGESPASSSQALVFRF
jgi:hypothetical protein